MASSNLKQTVPTRRPSIFSFACLTGEECGPDNYMGGSSTPQKQIPEQASQTAQIRKPLNHMPFPPPGPLTGNQLLSPSTPP